jgi:hypothetical protein
MNHKTNMFKHSFIVHILAATLVILAIIVYQLNSDIESTTRNKQITIDKTIDLEWSVLSSTIYDEVYKGSLQVNNISDILYRNLRMIYTDDMDKLLYDIEHIDPNAKLYKTIHNEIATRYINKDNKQNRIFISDDTKILSIVEPINTEFKQGSSISEYFNLIDSSDVLPLLNKSEPFLILKYNSSINNSKIVKITDIEKDYRINGTQCLSNYILLVPSYITKDGDIFGTSDYDATGGKQNNHKLYVIQQINISDAIKSLNVSNNFSNFREIINISNMYEIDRQYLRTFSLIGLFIVFIIMVLYMRNDYIDKKCE